MAVDRRKKEPVYPDQDGQNEVQIHPGCSKYAGMSDNIIKFQRPPKPKPPRQTPPWLKRLLIGLGIAAFFIAAFAYFSLTGQARP